MKCKCGDTAVVETEEDFLCEACDSKRVIKESSVDRKEVDDLLKGVKNGRRKD
jgi:DNA-directed RNA polymerase subunit RPC12/RpoP